MHACARSLRPSRLLALARSFGRLVRAYDVTKVASIVSVASLAGKDNGKRRREAPYGGDHVACAARIKARCSKTYVRQLQGDILQLIVRCHEDAYGN